jgi:hypothetical protein
LGKSRVAGVLGRVLGEILIQAGFDIGFLLPFVAK